MKNFVNIKVGIIYKYFNKIGVNFPPANIEDKYLLAKLALGEKVPNKTFYESLLSAEVIHKQTLESHEIHKDPINTIDYANDENKNSSTESMQIEKQDNPKFEEYNFLSILDNITQQLSNR